MSRDKNYERELKERQERQKVLHAIVEMAVGAVSEAIKDRRPRVSSHFFYGSSAIHPRHLVTWYLFKTDDELGKAEKNGLTGDIDRLTRAELQAAGYPSEGAATMLVSFTTEEDIQRKTGGDHWAYFR